jgi:hypothetical protein
MPINRGEEGSFETHTTLIHFLFVPRLLEYVRVVLLQVPNLLRDLGMSFVSLLLCMT